MGTIMIVEGTNTTVQLEAQCPLLHISKPMTEPSNPLVKLTRAKPNRPRFLSLGCTTPYSRLVKISALLWLDDLIYHKIHHDYREHIQNNR